MAGKITSPKTITAVGKMSIQAKRASRELWDRQRWAKLFFDFGVGVDSSGGLVTAVIGISRNERGNR